MIARCQKSLRNCKVFGPSIASRTDRYNTFMEGHLIYNTHHQRNNMRYNTQRTAKAISPRHNSKNTCRRSRKLKPTCQDSKLEVQETTIFTQTIRNQQHMERTQSLNCNEALKLNHQHIQAIPSEQCFNRTESFHLAPDLSPHQLRLPEPPSAAAASWAWAAPQSAPAASGRLEQHAVAEQQ